MMKQRIPAFPASGREGVVAFMPNGARLARLKELRLSQRFIEA